MKVLKYILGFFLLVLLWLGKFIKNLWIVFSMVAGATLLVGVMAWTCNAAFQYMLARTEDVHYGYAGVAVVLVIWAVAFVSLFQVIDQVEKW